MFVRFPLSDFLALLSAVSCFAHLSISPSPLLPPFVRVVTTPDGVEAVMHLGQGDMRRVLNLLQSTHMAYRMASDVFSTPGFGFLYL